MTILQTMAIQIIKEQELIIGSLAWDEAKRIDGLQISEDKKDVKISKNEQEVVDNLVKQYERLFGRASIEVCKEAVKELLFKLPKDQVPSMLR